MRTIIYSHGFGVDSTGRGLFTDIANALPNFNHVTFNYNQFDKSNNQMVVSTLDDQAEKLNRIINKQIEQGNEISLIAHSQGCVIAGLVAPDNMENVILLAPPVTPLIGGESKLLQREGTSTDQQGNILLPRADGTVTKISRAFIDSWNNIDPVALYTQLSEKTKLTIIRATQDEVLSNIDPSGIGPNVDIFDIAADHNFTGQARKELTDGIKSLLIKS